jgi:hypothetical protein
MKLLLRFSLFIIFGLNSISSLQAQNVTIPDVNFKAYLLGNTAINTNGDNEIQVSEATDFQGSISCNDLNIADMTGLEAFVNIQYLYCDHNQLTTLNLSSNLGLKTVYCNDNPLTFVDASNNTNLEELNAYQCQLTSINITNCTSLDDLYLYDNQLSIIDLSTNLALTAISLEMNQFETLDLSINPAITAVGVTDNQLTSLNLANGNNINFVNIQATNNPDLLCVQVDDEVYSNDNWNDGQFFNFDPQTSFSEDCSLGNSEFNTTNSSPIAVYPNPTKDLINFSEVVTIQLASVTGQILNSQKSVSFLDLSKQTAGIYFITITDSNGQVLQRSKIIKE